ncbi:MAG: hypothetical protein IPL34_20160 [Thiofilum sp.]|uniref:hypothetical protein n=1 Tax=Thiofilum sp. TaxID=2212733 RepID=UPI0025EACE3B|nr:hypothetical protein [Thiofilum sp.]MBK8455596.1 hypothetical protein [Thiofilum sp.]
MSETLTRDQVKQKAIQVLSEIGTKQYQRACIDQECIALYEEVSKLNLQLVEFQKADSAKGELQ